jgi:ribosomal protein L11 methyltransferase
VELYSDLVRRRRAVAWRLLNFEVADEHVEDVGALLEALGAVAVTTSGAAGEVVVEPQPGATPLWTVVRVQGLFPLETNIQDVETRLADACARLAIEFSSPSASVLEEDDWSNTWRRFAGPMSFGGRLTVVPRDWTAPVEGIVMRLDPGLAFGTGAHPTTALCLEWLARTSLAGKSVVDYGCGSGVLGIAALLLGATRVVAVDHDPQARVATADNAAYNGLRPGSARLLILAPEGLAIAEHDIVVANILADPLIALAPQLSRMVAVGGKLLLSGIRLDQVDRVVAAYTGVGFGRPAELDGWIAVEGTRLRA